MNQELQDIHHNKDNLVRIGTRNNKHLKDLTIDNYHKKQIIGLFQTILEEMSEMSIPRFRQ